jgi:hypothetical protein
MPRHKPTTYTHPDLSGVAATHLPSPLLTLLILFSMIGTRKGWLRHGKQKLGFKERKKSARNY